MVANTFLCCSCYKPVVFLLPTINMVNSVDWLSNTEPALQSQKELSFLCNCGLFFLYLDTDLIGWFLIEKLASMLTRNTGLQFFLCFVFLPLSGLGVIVTPRTLIKCLRECHITYFLKEILRNWHYFYLNCLGPELFLKRLSRGIRNV